jgi:peptide/nickel transport system substrate-binding protein
MPTTRRELLKRAGLAAPALAALDGGISGVRLERAAAQDAATASDQGGGMLVLLGQEVVASLSPDDASPTVQWVVVAQIHNALLEQDENLQLQPVLAAALPEIAPDGLTYTFRLQSNVTFHDGSPFSSADVKYTYDWYMNPANAANLGEDFASVAAVEAPDPLTVVVRLKQPNAAFLVQVGAKYILPATYHGRVGEEAYKSAPVGTGPFKLNAWNPAQSTLLDAYDGHFRGRSRVDQLRLDVVPEASVRYTALKNGEADSSVWPLVVEDDQALQESGKFTTYVTTQVAVNHIPLNNTNPKLADKRVRQAMLSAIDREAIRDDIFAEAATVATSNLSPALTDYYTSEVSTYPYDPERAAALLDEAGWVMGDNDIRQLNGEPLRFTCLVSDDQVRGQEAQVVQTYLREVGIDMQVQQAPTPTILDQMRTGQGEAALFNWTYGDQADPDPSANLGSTGYYNFSRYSNPRVDELIAAGLREVDRTARALIYHEIQRIIADEVPFLYIVYPEGYTHFSSRVQGLPADALYADNLYPKAWTFSLAPEE